mgnify:CR=1 FL=1
MNYKSNKLTDKCVSLQSNTTNTAFQYSFH